MSKLPNTTRATQSNHSLAAVLAYTELEIFKIRRDIGQFRLKAQLYAVGLKVLYQQLALLRV